MIGLAKDLVEDTYYDVEKMLQKLAWGATKRWGGAFEEYLSAANEAYVLAYNTYDPSKGTAFSTWVWWKVRGKIQEMVRPKKIEQMTVNPGEDIDLDVHASKKVFDFEVFLADLSCDAGVVVKALVDSPFELLDICTTKDGKECIKSGLTNQLKMANWSTARIMESFIELKEAII